MIDEYSREYVFNEKSFNPFEDDTDLFLIEARWAREYWRDYASLMPKWIFWRGRKHGQHDIVNKFLDIGYHYLTQYFIKRMEALDIPSEIGILHRAQSKNSHPLTYDLVEWMRPMVDKVVLTMLRQKKKIITELTQKDIKIFLYRLKQQMKKYYFHKERKGCITLMYWIDLYLLECRGAISHKKEFVFSFPPLRHDMRCSKQNKKLTIGKLSQ